MSAAALADAMHKAGCSVEQIVAALKEYEEGKRAKGRAANARRQAEFRARRNANNENNASNAVTQSNENNAVTPVTVVTPNEALSRARSLCEEDSIKNKTSNDVFQKDEPKSKVRGRQRTAINPELRPDAAAVEYAVSRGMPRSAVAGEFENFKNHHIARGTLSADWPASWRTWSGNYLKFGGNARAGPNGRNSKADPYSAAVLEIFGGKNEPDHNPDDEWSGSSLDLAAGDFRQIG